MNKPEFHLPPLPPDVSALLDAERLAEGPGPDMRVRMFSQIGATLGFPGAPGSPGSPGGGEGQGEAGGGFQGDGGGGGIASSGTSAAQASASSAAASALPTLVSQLAQPITVIAFAVGAITGAGTHAILRSPPAARVEAQAPAAGLQAPLPPPATPEQVQPPVPAALPDPAPAVPPEEPPPPRTKKKTRTKAGPHRAEALAKERQLIEVARAALARGREEDALSALDLHRQKFPHGSLTEERRALSILTRVAQGATKQAQTEARAFRAAYPQSLLLPAIERALSQLGKPR